LEIGLLSDTHGWLHPRWAHHFKGVDEIWHAGDLGQVALISQLEQIAPVRGVYGNIDGTDVRRVWPLWQDFTLMGKRIWMTHIAGYPGKYAAEVRQRLQTASPDLLICGHSHIVKVMRDPKFGHLHINPGAAGHHGWHKVMTLVRFSLTEQGISDFKLIELGERGQAFNLD
jgi:uncharacterized protein